MGASKLWAEPPSFLEEAETLQNGRWTVDLGLLYREDPVDFGLPDRDYQLNAPTLRLCFGAGDRVELQLMGDAYRVIRDQQGRQTRDSGDWELATKVWWFNQTPQRPAISFYYAVKLPNGDDERGGATDETDFFAYLLFDRNLNSRTLVHLNLGLGILGNPFANAAQNDVFGFGLSFERKLDENTWLVVEFGGRTGPKVNDDPRGLMVSFSHRFSRWVGYASLGAGLGKDEERSRLAIGFRRAFSLKHQTEALRHGRCWF
jgi:hypothetical protein